MRQEKDQFEASGIEVKIVSFDSPKRAKSYVKEMSLSWPLLLDEEMALYKAYGFEKGSFAKLMGPITVLKYIKLILLGHAGKPGKDIRQMGGNVLIDPSGTVRIHHASIQPHDRPTVAEIVSRTNTS